MPCYGYSRFKHYSFAKNKFKSGTQVKIKTSINVIIRLSKSVYNTMFNKEQGNLFRMTPIYFDSLVL